MKVNEKRKKMYLDGVVGIQYNSDNSGDRLVMLRQITDFESTGTREQYWRHTETFHPLSWFFEPDTERIPTEWRLNIDVDEWGLIKGSIAKRTNQVTPIFAIDGYSFPVSILHHIATPIYTTPFTLESGQQVELSETDINNIKQLP